MTSEPGSTTTPAVPNANLLVRLPPTRKRAEVDAARSSGNPASLCPLPSGPSQLRKPRLLARHVVLAPTTTKTAVQSKPTIAANASAAMATEATQRTKTVMTEVAARVVVDAGAEVMAKPMAVNVPSAHELRHHAPPHRLALHYRDVIVAAVHAAPRIADLPTETASRIAVPRLADATPVRLNSHPLNLDADAATVAA